MFVKILAYNYSYGFKNKITKLILYSYNSQCLENNNEFLWGQSNEYKYYKIK